MSIPPCPVDCACHTGPHAPCSVPGGCGSEGCGQQTAARGSCPCCGVRDPDYGLVCDPCRRWLPTALASIPGMYARLHDELIPHADADGRDPVAASLPAGPTGGAASDIPVSGGTGEAPVPLDLHLADMLGGVVRDGGRAIDVTGDNWVPKLDTRPRTVWVDNGTKGPRQATVLDRKPAVDGSGRRVMVPAGDQIGVVPVAQVIDQEVRAWIDAGAPGARWRPVPTVPVMVAWLQARLHWACDSYPHMDAFTAAIRRLRGQMMDALGEFDPEAELCDGVECRRCSLKMLFRRQDGTGDVECHNPACRAVLRADEYREWTGRLGGYERGQRDPAEVGDLLRQRASRTADLRRVE